MTQADAVIGDSAVVDSMPLCRVWKVDLKHTARLRVVLPSSSITITDSVRFCARLLTCDCNRTRGLVVLENVAGGINMQDDQRNQVKPLLGFGDSLSVARQALRYDL